MREKIKRKLAESPDMFSGGHLLPFSFSIGSDTNSLSEVIDVDIETFSGEAEGM